MIWVRFGHLVITREYWVYSEMKDDQFVHITMNSYAQTLTNFNSMIDSDKSNEKTMKKIGGGNNI